MSKEGSDTVTIVVNDVEIQVPQGELVVEAVKRVGQEVPIFCYHPRMKPVGMCRMCLVEIGFKQEDGSVRKMPKPQAACTLPVSEGMVIYTDTESIHKDRKGVLEFLLINHPLDCPVCDRGGECPLQNNTLFYGPSTSRYKEIKRHLPKAYPLSEEVTLDLERCIQCGRCVRFTEEISGDSQLAFRFRGAQMQPSTFKLTEFDSKFSGNTIEICPVGALTSSQYRFRARPWDLETKPAVCTLCSNGCNVWFDYRAGKFMRVCGRTNEAVNEEWTCDQGKFGHDFYNSDKRLEKPLIREGDVFKETDWGHAYDQIIKWFEFGGNQVGGLVKADFANEGLYCFQKLFRGYFKSNNIDHRWTQSLQSASERLENKAGIHQVQTSIAEFGYKKNILIFGTSLADDEPILYLRVRKASINNGAKVITANSQKTEHETFSEVNLKYPEGMDALVAAGLLKLVIDSSKKTIPSELKASLNGLTPEYVERETGLSAKDLKKAAKILCTPGTAIITTRELMNRPDAQKIIDILAGISIITDGEFNHYSVTASGQAAEDFGVLPDMFPGGGLISDDLARDNIEGKIGLKLPEQAGLGTPDIIKQAAEGNLKSLWLVNCDPIEDYHNPALARKALENVEFLVYQGNLEKEAMAYASVVLPMRAPAEQDTSFTNLERRVQRMKKILDPPGESKSAWRIFSEVMLRLRPSTPYFSAADVMEEIAEVIPMYQAAKYENLEGEGVLVKSDKELEPNLDFLCESFGAEVARSG